jgi:hypothetical protein
MTAAGLIDYHEQEYSWQSVNDRDNTKLVALFPEPRQVQNFAVLLRWARHDTGSIHLRGSWLPDATALSRHGVNSVMRYVESFHGGSSWTVYNNRVAVIRFLGDPYQVGGAGSGVQLPPMPLVQTFM